jgi:hypothetical protein
MAVMMLRSRRAAALAVLIAAAALPGCASERLSFDFGRPEPMTDGRAASAQRQGFDMTGRWTLAAGRGRCALTFQSIAGAMEGSVVPENNCPGKFVASRKWTLEQTGLVIRDQSGEPLAQLSMAGENFDGKSMAGEAVTLAR